MLIGDDSEPMMTQYQNSPACRGLNYQVSVSVWWKHVQAQSREAMLLSCELCYTSVAVFHLLRIRMPPATRRIPPQLYDIIDSMGAE